MDIKLKCSCGNPDCRQSVSIRKGAVFYPDHKDGNEPKHWNQGYIDIFGFEGKGFPEVMLDPEQMIKLRDWLNEVYPTVPTQPRAHTQIAHGEAGHHLMSDDEDAPGAAELGEMAEENRIEGFPDRCECGEFRTAGSALCLDCIPPCDLCGRPYIEHDGTQCQFAWPAGELMKKKQRRGSVSVSKDTYAALKAWCSRTGASMSSVVERLIEREIDEQKKEDNRCN